MNRTSTWAAWAVGISSLVAAASCGGSSDSGGGAGSSGAGGSDPGNQACSDCRVPPALPDNGVPGDGTGAVLAARRLFLGDRRTDGTPDSSAWEDFGYDIDGYKSTKSSAAHCQPVATANPASVKTDGNGGIDNSFGANLLPILSGLAPDMSTSVNDNIAAGEFAMLLQIDGLGAGADYVDLPSALYFGTTMTSPPAWDGNDAWPLSCLLLEDCRETGTKQLDQGNRSLLRFEHSYVANHTFVSGPRANVSLALSFAGVSFNLDVGQAVLTADLDAAASPKSGTNGSLSGIIDTEQLVGSLGNIAGSVSTSLCEGEALETVKQQVREASDIMVDGTQDPNATCNGISIGIGFQLAEVKLGTVMDKSPPGADPCAP